MSRKNVPSSSIIAGMETSAASVLIRAVEHDKEGRYPAALTCYQEGIQLFLDVIKMCDDKIKQTQLRSKAAEYMDRAEKVKDLCQKQKELGKYHEHVQITDGSTGYSYEKIFGKYLDHTVTKVEVYDAYIRNIHQFYNFLNFCELLVKSCKQLNNITLTTGSSNDQEHAVQITRFEDLKRSLKSHDVELNVIYSSTLHDREIRLDNGWIIKIGRGLDFFKNVQKFNIGFCEQTLRKCSETTIDIYFRNK